MDTNHKIEVNDKVRHKKLGIGTVIKVDNTKGKRFNVDGRTAKFFKGIATVSFTSPRMEAVFPIDWLLDKCDIIPKGRNDDNVSCEKDIEKIMERFNSFSLSTSSRQMIENLFRLKINYSIGHARPLRYNLLVQCNENEKAYYFIRTIQKSLKELKLLPGESKISREEDIDPVFRFNFDEDMDNLSMIVLHDCKAIEKDSVAMSSSSERENLQKEWKSKQFLWREIKKTADKYPECLFIVTGPKGFLDFVKENEDIFSDFLSYRIVLESRTLSEADIKDKVLACLAEEGLKTNKKFDAEIQKYIECVYPTAELQEEAFVDYLLNSILVNYYINPNGRIVTEQCVPFYIKPKTYEEIAAKLDEMVGLNRVKEEFKKIHALSKNRRSKNRMRLNFSFVGNPGTGKTTVARLTAELLYSMGLRRKNKTVEVTRTDIISQYVGESAQRMREKIEEARGGVLFIDEAYFLAPEERKSTPEQKCLETLLTAMENYKDDLTVIFAGYEKEIDTLIKSNPGLKSRMYDHNFVFEDYTDDELMQIFQHLLKKDGLTLIEDAKDALLNRISAARADENFGNARTVENLEQQIMAVLLKKPKDQDIVTKADILATMPPSRSVDLDQLIGLETVKKELAAFEKRVKYIKYLRDKNMSVPAPNLHMLFMGNPGTGKTMLAKKIADCLYQIGVLKGNNLVVAERKTLVSDHVGGTAIKTQEVIKKALNGVLFVDEAYSLAPEDPGRDFGSEAIETLITAMEDYKDRLVVIFAGYRREMNRFIQANAGISSRIGFKFYFPDYTPDELTEMFKRRLESSGFAIADNALDKVKKLMTYFSAQENFGNGRFVDRVIDSTINKRSLRSYGTKFNDIEECDIPEIEDVARVMTEVLGVRPNTEKSDLYKKRIAVHELGHAIVGFALQPERKIDSVSVNEDASSMGRVAINIRRDDAYTEFYMKCELAILFGGRNAERIVFGEHSTGCWEDMSRAKEMAEEMINEYAMGEFGITTAMDLLKEADKTATEVLLKHKEKIMNLVDILLNRKSVSGDEFGKLLQNESEVADKR